MAMHKKRVTRLDSHYMQQYDVFMERQKRKKQRLVRRLVLFSVIVLLVVGSLATYHINQRILHAEKSEQYQELKEQLTSLKTEEENYQEEIGLLNNEEYVLEIARTNYFLSKEGELIFKVLDESPSY